MKIVRLQAEGFKRLVAVDITPTGDLVEVRGNNAEGKSSVLDSIYAALGGAAAMPIKPVRTGEEYAIIRADLGDLKVTRYFSADGTDRLKVENGEGASYAEPQTILNKLVGRIAFDPLAFARMEPKEQAAELRRLVPLAVDLDALAKADRDDTAARRDVNRDAKALRARIDAIEVSGIVPPKPDRDAIVAALTGAAGVNAGIERERNRREQHSFERGRVRTAALGFREEAKRLRALADAADANAASEEETFGRMQREAGDWPALAEPVDTAKLSAELAEADRALALHARIAERKRLEADFEKLRQSSEGFTAAMAARAEQRAKALAEAAMPVDGLSLAPFGDDMLLVTYQGEPFAQASAAQQLRVSMALAMAANPKLRVMLIKDGSLLDPNGLTLVREMAAAGDYQVWLEAVGEGDGVGIIMEAGKVRGAPEPERVEPPKRRKAKAEAADNAAESGAAASSATQSEKRPDLSTGAPERLEPVPDERNALGDAPKPRPKPKPKAFNTAPAAKPSDLFGGEK